ncbi:hypothetical protein O181_099917 [Austropuccinia psidii MF-1]|uniref:Uncharacterized protein n=1 Tax=Austropuccinia psidii MF-1 TaxID=1389203 RepID=A0A9Q3JD63_9BASI|nr:hypothetical protein [Austropuccinia psidii MF-1]
MKIPPRLTVSLERSHVVVPGCKLQISGGIYEVERMGLLEKRFQFLRHPLLMELQRFLIVSNLSISIEFVGGRPIYYSSEVPISRINTDGVVKTIRRIADSPPDPDAEGSDELDGEEVEVVPHSVGHPSSTSSSQPLANRFHSNIIPSTPRTFQPTLAAIPTSLPPASPSPSIPGLP